MCEDVPVENWMPGKQDEVEYNMQSHAVIREDMVTTKLRVVFDASSQKEGSEWLFTDWT